MARSLVGRVLLGQYRVMEFISHGGMGAVYRVWDKKRKAYLAMKVLHPDFAEDPHVLKRFRREAEALRRLNHPNIVRFFGLYQEGEMFFLLEQFIDGNLLVSGTVTADVVTVGTSVLQLNKNPISKIVKNVKKPFSIVFDLC